MTPSPKPATHARETAGSAQIAHLLAAPGVSRGIIPTWMTRNVDIASPVLTARTKRQLVKKMSLPATSTCAPIAPGTVPSALVPTFPNAVNARRDITTRPWLAQLVAAVPVASTSQPRAAKPRILNAPLVPQTVPPALGQISPIAPPALLVTSEIPQLAKPAVPAPVASTRLVPAVVRRMLSAQHVYRTAPIALGRTLLIAPSVLLAITWIPQPQPAKPVLLPAPPANTSLLPVAEHRTLFVQFVAPAGTASV